MATITTIRWASVTAIGDKGLTGFVDEIEAGGDMDNILGVPDHLQTLFRSKGWFLANTHKFMEFFSDDLAYLRS